MPITITQSLDTLPGVGPARSKALQKLGLFAAGDLLDYFPREYEDRSLISSITDAGEEEPVCFQAMVTEAFHTSHIRKGMDLTKGRVSDHSAQVQVTFFNQSYVAGNLKYGEEYVFYGKLTGTGSRRQMANPYFEPAGTHRLTGGIIPVYPLTAGISLNLLAGLARRVLPCAAQKEEVLPPGILNKYELAQAEFSYRNIHFPASWEDLDLARRRLMFEELLCLSLGLSLLRARRSQGGGTSFAKGNPDSFYQLLPYTLTGAQKRAVEEIAEDLGKEVPMNRLLQGDVGSGKTVVAAAAVFLAHQNGMQAALMAPTELLARQHQRTMEGLLAPAGLRIGLLTGSMTAAQKRALRASIAAGEIDLLVGTHAVISESVEFHRLGLVITDEQHRFGVTQRAALTAKAGEGGRPHVLVMSATPIPRTLALMVYGDLDLSVIDELPPGRKPVSTYLVREDKRQRLYNFIRTQALAGRQVYIVCPKVEEGDVQGLKAAEEYGAQLQRVIFPDLKTAVIHGRMKPKEKEAVMNAFVGGDIQILVSTTVIEVGVDVPNASLMVIENAERFGLSQLHQLRGRVGRGPYESHCVLISDARAEHTLERLKALTKTNDGFQIAEEDLRLRGPGDFFGARQHGLPQLKIADLAGDMRLLKEAQTAAQEIIGEDPELNSYENRGLRAKVLRLFEENRDSFQ